MLYKCDLVGSIRPFVQSTKETRKKKKISDILIKFDLSNAVAAAGVYNLLKISSIPFLRLCCATTSHMAENLRKRKKQIEGQEKWMGCTWVSTKWKYNRKNKSTFIMRAGISTHTVHTHTRWWFRQRKEIYTQTRMEWRCKEEKSKQIAHPILISLAAMQVERAPVCLCIAEFELKPEERERVKDNKKTTTKRLCYLSVYIKGEHVDVSQK